VAAWGENGALEAVQAFAGRIDEVARRIEDALADERLPTSSTEVTATPGGSELRLTRPF
jgi:hypothetical protein